MYHASVKVEPAMRSLRKRKQVNYNFDDTNQEAELSETFHDSFEEHSVLANSKKFSAKKLRKQRKASDMTDVPDYEDTKLPNGMCSPKETHSAFQVSEFSKVRLDLLVRAFH